MLVPAYEAIGLLWADAVAESGSQGSLAAPGLSADCKFGAYCMQYSDVGSAKS